MEEYFETIKKACMFDDIDSIKDYVKAGHINYENKYYVNILNIAAINNKYEICEYLIKNGANINSIHKSPLVGAAQYGNYAICKLLLENGADVNIQETKNGYRTALHATCLYSNIEIMELLLDYQADYKIKNNFDYNCIDNAKYHDHWDVTFFRKIYDKIKDQNKFKIRKHLLYLKS